MEEDSIEAKPVEPTPTPEASADDANKKEIIEKDSNCYCGKERNLNIVELLCASCSRWFHESCINYQLGKLVPFMTNYSFVCKNCSVTSLESFKKNQSPFPQMILTALGNLHQASVKEGKPQTLFSKDKDIIPFIDSHWESMTTIGRRVTQSWHSTIQKALAKDTGSLFVVEEVENQGEMYGLAVPLTEIKPNYDAMIKNGALKITDVGVQHGQSSGGVKSRNAKRKFVGDQGGGGPGKKGRGGGDASAPKLPAHGYPLEHPYNKDGYRYILAEPDTHAPFRQEFDESNEWSGKPIPGWLYRMLNPNQVLLALHDRAPQLKVSEDRLSVTGEKGYCMIRATHGKKSMVFTWAADSRMSLLPGKPSEPEIRGASTDHVTARPLVDSTVSRGQWFFEVTIEEMPEGTATRIGWAQEYANLQAPLGYDKFGYSWRSRKGTRFHECRGKHFSTGYGEGDTLGFLIILPESSEFNYIPPTYKDRPLVKFKSHLYYEEKDQVQETLKKLKPLPGSKIIFFKNGECQGIAFEDIYAGGYYPAISLHKSCTVSLNCGPSFKHPPTDYKSRGMYEKAEEAIVEQTMADILYLTENDGKLRLDTYCM